MENSNIEQTIQSQPPQEQQEQHEPIHPLTQKFYMLLVILGIIFLASVFLAALYLIGARTTQIQQKQTIIKVSPTPTPNLYAESNRSATANWKGYKSKKDSYSFKYPENWQYQPNSEGCGPVFRPSKDNNYWLTICGPYFESPETLANKEKGSNISINLFNVTINNHKGIREEIEYIENKNIGNYKNIISVFIADVKTIVIDGNNLKQQQVTGTIDVLFEKLNNKFTSEEKHTFNQILSTFKFIDQNLTPTPSCMPRPACLDATPRCLIAEPINGWCPTPTPKSE